MQLHATPIVVCFTQLPKNTLIQKDWERMWEKRQDRGRVRSKVWSRGIFVDSFVSFFFDTHHYNIYYKKRGSFVLQFGVRFDKISYYSTGISQIPAQIAFLVYHPTNEKNSDEFRVKEMAAEFA